MAGRSVPSRHSDGKSSEHESGGCMDGQGGARSEGHRQSRRSVAPRHLPFRVVVTHATRWWTEGAGNGASGPAPPRHVVRFRGRKQKASSKLFPHVPEAPRRCSPSRAAAGGQGVVCWNAVKNVQMPVMWKGKPSPSVLRQRSRHQGQSWLLRALGCRALWTPRTWPPGLVPILPPGRAVQERRHHWNFGKSWLFIKTWRGWTEHRLQTLPG